MKITTAAVLMLTASAGLGPVFAQTNQGTTPQRSAPQTTTTALTRAECASGWNPSYGIDQAQFQSLCLAIQSGSNGSSGAGTGGGTGNGSGSGGSGAGGSGGGGGAGGGSGSSK